MLPAWLRGTVDELREVVMQMYCLRLTHVSHHKCGEESRCSRWCFGLGRAPRQHLGDAWRWPLEHVELGRVAKDVNDRKGRENLLLLWRQRPVDGRHQRAGDLTGHGGWVRGVPRVEGIEYRLLGGAEVLRIRLDLAQLLVHVEDRLGHAVRKAGQSDMDACGATRDGRGDASIGQLLHQRPCLLAKHLNQKLGHQRAIDAAGDLRHVHLVCEVQLRHIVGDFMGGPGLGVRLAHRHDRHSRLDTRWRRLCTRHSLCSRQPIRTRRHRVRRCIGAGVQGVTPREVGIGATRFQRRDNLRWRLVQLLHLGRLECTCSILGVIPMFFVPLGIARQLVTHRLGSDQDRHLVGGHVG
mmetsp:Transcript_13383/g.34313  ORF Transcript_13383/g.34313 Transcript_13383/m.34313 type:complete len:353 (+) Transcript_13383:885-1943(+)